MYMYIHVNQSSKAKIYIHPGQLSLFSKKKLPCTCMYVCMYICMYVCVCVCVHSFSSDLGWSYMYVLRKVTECRLYVMMYMYMCICNT